MLRRVLPISRFLSIDYALCDYKCYIFDGKAFFNFENTTVKTLDTFALKSK